MKIIEHAIVLEKGVWRPDQLEIRQIAGKLTDQLHRNELEAIEENWQKILLKNRSAFAGPTVRLMSRRYFDNRLILEVVPSDYKESCLLGWLGAAMVPVTSDGYIALQGSVDSIAATIGEGIRVPGCTPVDTGFIPHIIKEMKEEFEVDITKDNLTIQGLIEVRPPIANLHHGLVVKVKLSLTHEGLKECWEQAEDKWEGELIFLKLDYEKKIALLPEIGDLKTFHRSSLVILAMIIESEFGISCINRWPQISIC